MKNLRTLPENIKIQNKIVFLRVDFNVPIRNGKISDNIKILKMKGIVKEFLSRKAKIILCSHLGRPQKKGKKGLSMISLKKEIEKIFKQKIDFLDDLLKKNTKKKITLSKKKLFLLENIRFYKEEEQNNARFAKKLANLADLYVNEAFSCSHRSHASITAITKFIDSYAGKTIIEELSSLKKIFYKSNKPITCIIGGSKISTKIDLISNLIKQVDTVIIGGAMANNFLKYNNYEIGKSLIEPDKENTIKNIISETKKYKCNLYIPEDVVVAKNESGKAINKSLFEIQNDDIIFDIGKETIVSIRKIIDTSKTILWNGPVGFFEKNSFANGSNKIAHFIKNRTKKKLLVSIAGGGDTAAAIRKAGAMNGFSYISTAGGAFLEWLEGKTLPGLKVLEK